MPEYVEMEISNQDVSRIIGNGHSGRKVYGTAIRLVLACAITGSVPLVTAHAQTAVTPVPGFPAPTTHTQQVYSPFDTFTSRWTRADARQIKARSDPNVAVGANSMPTSVTMPDIPADFPQTNPDVWLWDTWTLIDAHANQFSYNGWEVIFALTADPNAGYTFDDRHVHARISYFYRRAGIPASARPRNGGWIYGGHLFPDGASVKVFGSTPLTNNAEWSGSTRLLKTDGNEVAVFYTALGFNRTAEGANIAPPVAIISKTNGRIHADLNHVWFTGFNNHTGLLQPDGTYYQTGQQNEFYSFRDPFTFEDPQNPGQTFMVFEGNTAGERGAKDCTAADLGYQAGDPNAEDLDTVQNSGATYQKANIGLAVSTDSSLTQWRFLPPLISANCVNDQTERPQVYIKDGKYYLFTISHRSTFAAGIDGPDGVYGFVGNGLRSDFEPLNWGSGLALGNPTDLNTAAGSDFDPDPQQNPRAFQAYSHYVMPNGLVESFIDTVEGRRGGALAPTVKIQISDATTQIDLSYGQNGLGGYGNIPANRYDLDWQGFVRDLLQSGRSPNASISLASFVQQQ
ncbi:levansucrase [Komagataeibacter oboediens DSM 11826]|uniref:Glycoside hydrolase 68 family protein n=2 Tax=Acetobacteraceae TaxID=433 RepID=A0A318QVS7_9PROT|nr:glycoside hydrolase family 68 protein [Komagataeibacter oboediens]MBT0675862.1 glycoside hydrolase family 68 protein [Komagataeibacter oboediens]MBT0677736.1 glycoside hydrolase family 68 protein [Komagataeibacter oboediens]PYD82124.1 glycoside hydrolase 68 family protein [Komagataeibacter oboediens]GBR32540.1 levansucrase [Komagataeibacter oboediens DSM 11826]